MVPPCRSTAAPSHLVPGLILGGPLPRAPGVIRAASPSPRASAGHASTQRDNDDDRQQHHIPVHRTLRAPQRLLGPEGARASSHLRRGYRCFSTSRCFVPAKVTGPAGITTFSRAPRPGNARRPGIGDVSPWQDGAHLIHRHVHQIQLDAPQAACRDRRRTQRGRGHPTSRTLALRGSNPPCLSPGARSRTLHDKTCKSSCALFVAPLISEAVVEPMH